MSAELYLELAMKLTNEEFAKVFKVISKYVSQNDKKKKVYFLNMKVNGTPVKDVDPDSDSVSGEVGIRAEGPYGDFLRLTEVRFFRDLAKAAPDASFKGEISGNMTYVEVSQKAELKDGELHLYDYYLEDDMLPIEYEKKIKKLLPYSRFCKLFKVDREDFEKNDYSDFITEAIGDEGFPNIDYDTFMDYCDSAEIDEDKYESVIEQLQDLGLVDYDTFVESVNYDDYVKHSVIEVK